MIGTKYKIIIDWQVCEHVFQKIFKDTHIIISHVLKWNSPRFRFSHGIITRFNCSKSTIKATEKGLKFVQS